MLKSFQKYGLLFNPHLLDDSEFLALYSSKKPLLYLVFKDSPDEAFNSMVKCSSHTILVVPMALSQPTEVTFVFS